MPAFSPEDFGRKVQEIADKTNKKIEQVAEDFTILYFTQVIEGTPVGDPSTWQSQPPPGYIGGRAKANWNPSVGSPDYSQTDSLRSSVNKLPSIKGRIAGNVAYLSNSVPYVYLLEKGIHTGTDGRQKGSYQQPNGWIERTTRGTESIMNKVIRNNS
jgi:hypothetical protein